MDTEERPPRKPSQRPPLVRWTPAAGWVRCQVMGRPAQLWTRPATQDSAEATPSAEETSMLKRAKSRAATLWSSSAGLYREMALSALRLVRR
jgi:hypothetical protein